MSGGPIARTRLGAVPKGAGGPRRIGAYHLLTQLGEGGMGTVHIALKAGAGGFERLVVVKHVHAYLGMLPGTLEMQLDEARVASLIHHPNVASVIDVVEEGRELSLVQEYHESLSLAALLVAAARATTPLAAPVVGRIVCDMLAGLHAAHEAADLRGRALEVVHRDVKPHNVVVGTNGTTKLVDFGISKAALRLAVTEPGVLKGSLPYLSPEQVLGLELDRRTDIFSAGIVLYEALAGEPPVRRSRGEDMLEGILPATPSPPSSVVPSIPKAFDEIVVRALALERSERFQTAAEFQQAIERSIVIASPAEVAQTVERLGGLELRRRRAAVAAALDECVREEEELERASTDRVQREAVPPAPTAEGPVNVPPRAESRFRRRAFALAACLIGIGTTWFGLRATVIKPPPDREPVGASFGSPEMVVAPLSNTAPPSAPFAADPSPTGADSVPAPPPDGPTRPHVRTIRKHAPSQATNTSAPPAQPPEAASAAASSPLHPNPFTPQ